MADLMFAGIGGQGVLTAGKILIEIAAEEGKNVCWTSEYSAEMRGGTALCRVVVADEEIGSPYPDQLDVLCCLNEGAYHTYVDQVRPGGKVIINASVFEQKEFDGDNEVYSVNATDIAMENKNERGLNLIMLGALLKATGMFDQEAFAGALKSYFEKKGKGSDKNLTCFNQGYTDTVKL